MEVLRKKGGESRRAGEVTEGFMEEASFGESFEFLRAKKSQFWALGMRDVRGGGEKIR